MPKTHKQQQQQGDKVLYVRIPAEQMRRLKLLAVERDTRVATLVRQALTKTFGKELTDVKN